MNSQINNGIYEPHPISSIELLGQAKNGIVEVREMEEDNLSFKQLRVLSAAYHQLDEIQQYLFNH